MALYIFQGGRHFARLNVDKDYNIRVSTEVTNYNFVDVYTLFGKEKADKLKEKVRSMDKNEFDNYVKNEFKTMGYTFVGKYDSQ